MAFPPETKRPERETYNSPSYSTNTEIMCNFISSLEVLIHGLVAQKHFMNSFQNFGPEHLKGKDHFGNQQDNNIKLDIEEI